MSSKNKPDRERTVHSSVKQRSREQYAERKQRYRAKTRLTETEKSVVDQMHPAARKRFLQFSYIDQKRFLKKAERILKNQEKKDKEKESAKNKKRFRKEKPDKILRLVEKIESEQNMSSSKFLAWERAVSAASDIAVIMNALLSEADTNDNREETSSLESRVSGNAARGYHSVRQHVRMVHKKLDKSNQKKFIMRKK